MNLRLLHDQAAIKPLPPVLTKGLLHLPEKQEWLDREKGQAIEGIVLMVGLGDKIALSDPPDCIKCYADVSSEFLIMTNSWRCTVCGEIETAESRRYRFDLRRQVTRAPMFLEVGQKVMYWPTQSRLKKIEIDGELIDCHVCHSEQHPVLVMSDRGWQPLYDRLLVKDLDAPDMSAGGVAIPRTAKRFSHQGEVLAVGNGKRLADGSMAPLSVRAGERIAFADNAGQEIRLDQESFLVLREDEILAVLPPVEEAA